MTPHVLWGVAILVAMMVAMGWLSNTISWLDRQGGFTQGIAVAAVLTTAGGLWWLFQELVFPRLAGAWPEVGAAFAFLCLSWSAWAFLTSSSIRAWRATTSARKRILVVGGIIAIVPLASWSLWRWAHGLAAQPTVTVATSAVPLAEPPITIQPSSPPPASVVETPKPAPPNGAVAPTKKQSTRQTVPNFRVRLTWRGGANFQYTMYVTSAYALTMHKPRLTLTAVQGWEPAVHRFVDRPAGSYGTRTGDVPLADPDALYFGHEVLAWLSRPIAAGSSIVRLTFRFESDGYSETQHMCLLADVVHEARAKVPC